MSQYSANYSPNGLNDGVKGVAGSGEWAAQTTAVPTWAQLTWQSAVGVSTVVLYDRPNLTDQILAGKLWFSDGTWVDVGALPNDGSPLTVAVGSKNTTSVRFEITSRTGLPGLSEIEVG